MPPPPHPTDPATSLRRSGAGRSPDTRLDSGLRRNDGGAVCDCRIHRPAASLVRLLVGLWLAIGLTAALAESVSVGDLRLDYGDAWQRASAEEEAQAESVILRQAESSGPVTVTIPKHQSRLRVPEARFYQQLETVWRAGAGEALRLDWLEAGGRRWRVARRPSLEAPDRAVFHLVTVADGLAQHLLVAVPARMDALPATVHALLSGKAPPTPASAAAMTPPAAENGPTAEDTPGPAQGWQLRHSLQVLPADAEFDALIRQERQRLRPDGGITGMGIEAQAHGLTAFLSGFVQTAGTGGRQRRQDFSHAWDIAWEPPANELPSGAPLQLRPSRLPPGVGLRVRLRHYCGSAEEMSRLEQRLQQAVTHDHEAATSRGCSVLTAGRALAEIIGSASVQRPVIFSIEAPPTDRRQHLLVLSVQPFVVGEASGAALLGAAAVHYLYRPAGQR